MVKLEVQKRIIERAFKKHPLPFDVEQETFRWTGSTKVTSRQTERTYEINVDISLKPNKRLFGEVSACLCKPEGVRFEDLVIVTMIDPKIQGTIRLTGLPRADESHDFAKFVKKVSEAAEK
ncbi:hypothetical protein [Alicyclobacillus pomorum]|jgi:hypothetical protein|uniref:hypothetical protein n=1 Tax=Alicyclobacillus pomorum TaxID=204470 RepID=UPI00040ADC1F|nr:hypothetical protein [Alicyclobacillus pomorum]